ASAIVGVPMFMLMSGGTVWQAVVGQSVLFICVSVVNGASFVTYVEMLKASVRYSGIALGNNVTNMCLGGTAPFIATWLIDVTGKSLAQAGYFAFCALLPICAVFFIEETKGIELRTDYSCGAAGIVGTRRGLSIQAFPYPDRVVRVSM